MCQSHEATRGHCLCLCSCPPKTAQVRDQTKNNCAHVLLVLPAGESALESQGEQEPAPGLSLYLPAGQFKQVQSAELKYLPISHSEQV